MPGIPKNENRGLLSARSGQRSFFKPDTHKKKYIVTEMTIRGYHENDAPSVGQLIADTCGEYNLDFLPVEARGPFLGPFQHARSPDKAHQEAIARVIRSEMVFVAENDGEIVGVLRGRKERLASLFVRGDHHRQGIGRRLVERFEQACLEQDELRSQRRLP
jgi:GNAT superfamily N-acetyltransferase